MQSDITLPDPQRRDRLESCLTDLRRAQNALDSASGVRVGGKVLSLSGLKSDTREQVDRVKAELEEIPEMDPQKVVELVDEALQYGSTEVDAIGGEIRVDFEFGDPTEMKQIRYRSSIGSKDEELRVEVDGEWEVVWSN